MVILADEPEDVWALRLGGGGGIDKSQRNDGDKKTFQSKLQIQVGGSNSQSRAAVLDNAPHGPRVKLARVG
ncbi:MAG: hypothetical protein NTY01_19520, partial [Verrucomicrobia bacterium]|nr:hypothetical protein [Verrucomicrobiota bacterium]